MVLSGPLEVVLIVLFIGYTLVRRVLGEPAQGKRMLLLPVILTGVGLLTYTKTPESATGTWVLVGSVAVSVILGFFRGVSIRTFDRDGIVFMKYTAMTIVLWVVNLGVKFGLNFLVAGFDRSSAASLSHGLLLSLGSGILVEGCVVMNKALRSENRVIWQKGKNGEPHATSGFIDGLQKSFRAPTDGQSPVAPRETGSDRENVDTPAEPWANALSALSGALRDRRSDRGRDRRRR